MAANSLLLEKKRDTPFLIVSVFLLSVFLNQSNVLFGINLSFSDIFIVGVMASLILKQELKLPLSHILVFSAFSILILVHSLYIIPNQYMIAADPLATLIDYTKLLVVFLYYILGFNLTRLKLTAAFLKGFVVGSVGIGFLGILISFVQIPYLSSIMLFGESRLIGLMNDPNFFAVIQCCALSILLRMKPIKMVVRIGAIGIILLSIISSGSKSGIILVVLYSVYFLIEKVVKMEKATSLKVVGALLSILGLSAIVPNLLRYSEELMDVIVERFPIFSRVELLFTDFSSAVSDGGSGRAEVWETALHMIDSAPLLGVGLGNYIPVANQFIHNPNVAHNTYLQLAAEWGIVLTVLFLLYVGSTLIDNKRSISKNEQENQNRQMIRDILIIFLIASVSISLNNARIFWLVLGMSVFQTRYNQPANQLLKGEKKHESFRDNGHL
ncbi:O-antigen ligase family protein [Carnobacterium pleistocenium]|uniref:O-antigen ligase family protein n=1 Tax=Carnobacterium pleistocenium TaxID=181073 RepID=UPI00068B2F33|nr:O-antigen ligase family protein [Carnobacterium pleistocenium]